MTTKNKQILKLLGPATDHAEQYVTLAKGLLAGIPGLNAKYNEFITNVFTNHDTYTLMDEPFMLSEKGDDYVIGLCSINVGPNQTYDLSLYVMVYVNDDLFVLPAPIDLYRDSSFDTIKAANIDLVEDTHALENFIDLLADTTNLQDFL